MSVALLTSMTLLFVSPLISPASAQTQIVTASPGYINLGMTTSIAVTAPASGTYTVVIEKPSGATSSLPYTFTAASQTVANVFGNTSGFGGDVNLVGTYNVFVEQGSQVVGTTSFYATNKLVVSMDMVNGGLCAYVQGAPRGEKMFPRFYIDYASNGAPLTNATPGMSVKYTLPDKSVATAGWDAGAHLYVGKIYIAWNYTSVGTWSPAATISDGAGNSANYTYSGAPFTITPSQLATSIVLVDAKTGQVVTSLYSGENVTVKATITYPTNPEPSPGFVGPLDAASKGGSVGAQIGYGFYNATAGTFGGSAKNPGTLLGTIAMTYSGANGTWTGQYTAGTLPALPAGTLFQVVVTSSDRASPPNTGLGALSVAPSVASPVVTASTSATSSTSSTTAPPITTTSTITTTVSQITQSIPTIAYAGMVILLALGLIIGLVLRMRR